MKILTSLFTLSLLLPGIVAAQPLHNSMLVLQSLFLKGEPIHLSAEANRIQRYGNNWQCTQYDLLSGIIRRKPITMEVFAGVLIMKGPVGASPSLVLSERAEYLKIEYGDSNFPGTLQTLARYEKSDNDNKSMIFETSEEILSPYDYANPSILKSAVDKRFKIRSYWDCKRSN